MYIEINRLSGLAQFATGFRRPTFAVTAPLRPVAAPVVSRPTFGLPVVAPTVPRPSFWSAAETVSKIVKMVAPAPVSWPRPRPVSRIPTGVIAMPGVKRARLAPLVRFPTRTPTLARKISAQFDARMLFQRFPLRMKSRSGATLESTKIQVVAGVDPATVGINESGAATTGQAVSIKEQTPNTVTVTEQAGQLRIEPLEIPKQVAPERPLFREPPSAASFITFEKPTIDVLPAETFVDAAAAEKSNVLKYGLLAFGAYVMLKSFKDVKPKGRRPRRRRRR